MKLHLPAAPDRWTPEYQRRLIEEIESVLTRLNVAQQVPHGGTSGQVLTKTTDRSLDLGWATPAAGAGGANPTASVGLAAVNGAAGTFMRSDAAPPMDVGIAPTWGGVHTHDATLRVGTSTTTRAFVMNGPTSSARDIAFRTADVNRWILRVNNTAESGASVGSDLELLSRDDAGAALTTALRVNRATGQFRFTNGSASLPVLSFQSDIDTGINWSTANVIDFVCGGVLSMTLTNGIFNILSTNPRYRLYDSNGATNEKYTELNGDAGGLAVNFLDDSGANPITALVFFRTGTNVDSMEIRADSAYVIGTLISLQGAQCDIFGSVSFYSTVSPAQITANQNDYAPTGLSASSQARINSDAARSITGIANGVAGRILILHNVGSFDITLVNESASSTAGNRFSFGADLVLRAGFSCVLAYDSTTGRWRKIAEPPPLAVGVPRRTSGFANGECTALTAGATINTSDLAAGVAFSIYNDSASSITITQGASVTLRQDGTANTGNRTLAARGLAYVWCNSSSEAIISGCT